jgi:3-oxoacyl-[acyl-carrier protein] reductase
MATERGVSARKSWQISDIPIGRFADPDEVAVMVTWLATARQLRDRQAINVDGGIAKGLL